MKTTNQNEREYERIEFSIYSVFLLNNLVFLYLDVGS